MSFEELLSCFKIVATSKNNQLLRAGLFDDDNIAQSLSRDPIITTILAEYSPYFQSYQKMAKALAAEPSEFLRDVHAQCYRTRRDQAQYWLKTTYPHSYATQEQRCGAIAALLQDIHTLLDDCDHQQSLLAQEQQRHREFAIQESPQKIEAIIADFKKYLAALAKEMPQQSFSVDELLCLKAWIDAAPANSLTQKNRWGALLETLDEARTAHFMIGSYNNEIYSCPKGLEQRLLDRAYLVMLSENPDSLITNRYKLVACLMSPFIQRDQQTQHLIPTNALYQSYLKAEGLTAKPIIKTSYRLQAYDQSLIIAQYVTETEKSPNDFFEQMSLLQSVGLSALNSEDRVFFQRVLTPVEEQSFVLCYETTGALFDGVFEKSPDVLIGDMSQDFMFGHEHVSMLLALLGQSSFDPRGQQPQHAGVEVLREYARCGKTELSNQLLPPPDFCPNTAYLLYDTYLEKISNDASQNFFITLLPQQYRNERVFRHIKNRLFQSKASGLPLTNALIKRLCQEEKLQDCCADLLLFYLEIEKYATEPAQHGKVFKEHEEMIKFLLSRGARQELIDSCGRQAVLTAIENNWPVRMIELLLSHSKRHQLRHPVGLESANSRGQTALLLASCKNNIDLVKYLLEQGARLGATDNNKNNALTLALLTSDERTALLLLRSQTPDNFLDVHTADTHGDTPLMLAAAAGFVPVVRYLLKQKVNPWALNYLYQTALYQAALYQHTAVCLLLLLPQYQPSFSQRFSFFCDYLKIGKIFFEHPAAASAGTFSDLSMSTVWGCCLQHNDEVLAQALIDSQIPHPTTTDGRNLIMTAILEDSYRVLDRLLEAYPELIEKTDCNGQTAIYYAACHNNTQPMAALLNKGANPFVRNHQRANILHTICQTGHHPSVLIEVLRHDNTVSLLDQYDADGKTPVAIALEKANPEMIRALLPYKNNPEFYKDYFTKWVAEEDFEMCQIFLRYKELFSKEILSILMPKLIARGEKNVIIKLLEAGFDLKPYGRELLILARQRRYLSEQIVLGYDEDFLSQVLAAGVPWNKELFEHEPKFAGDNFSLKADILENNLTRIIEKILAGSLPGQSDLILAAQNHRCGLLALLLSEAQNLLQRTAFITSFTQFLEKEGLTEEREVFQRFKPCSQPPMLLSVDSIEAPHRSFLAKNDYKP